LHASANIVAIAVGLAMTASGRENGADAKNTGSRNLPFGNGGPQCENNFGITGGAHVAHGSKTRSQRNCRVVSCIETDLGIRIFDPDGAARPRGPIAEGTDATETRGLAPPGVWCSFLFRCQIAARVPVDCMA
jgi:hypothetical protein